MNGKELRLRRLFPSPRARLFAVPLDHSLSVGPIEGLRQLEPTARSLQEGGVRCLIVHKGGVRTIAASLMPSTLLGVHLSASTSLAQDTGRKRIAGTVAEAVRLGADLVSVQVNFGDPAEGEMLEDLGHMAEECEALGMPLLCMTYVRSKGKEIEEAALAHACRAAADLGADVIKTNFPSSHGFRRLVESTPVPVLVGGGPKLDREEDLLQLVRDATEAGARGICIGRNLFQSSDIVATARKVASTLDGVAKG
ncbi:MAG: fructose-bisphosphate aldolase [Euryarchaeota archaeon]|nr:fructose-bisphosphate aldolase [Euryarchaeota archaeon]MDE1837114.1 fructose-bisphosphate aldolase [Euryarchaeota archaeon]MDE1879674.1 fructose-bisphosphate aldolase [Euryarchaeota archaeon]MDE2045200.1 fructose-bisphosphate aldolase [Thermoplasmata archaeon]